MGRVSPKPRSMRLAGRAFRRCRYREPLSVEEPVLLPRPFGGAVYGVARALSNRYTPLNAQLVVTRRCNLSCGYCNEYDNSSPPVDLERLTGYVDRLTELGCVVLTFTGGEPLLNPRLDDVCAHAVSRGLVVTAITNGYPITRDWIRRLDQAGLTLLQVSIDNLEPNETSQKSWSRVRGKLELLREHAGFAVNVNSVLGSCPPEQARMVAREVRAMGFYQTIQLMHDGMGQVASGLIGDDHLPGFFAEMRHICRKSLFHRFGEGWEAEMLASGRSPWKCRAGSRYLYVDELGMVSYCSQRRGDPGIPLLAYTTADLARAWHTAKGCEDGCTIGCVRRASAIDERRPQRGLPMLRVPTLSGASGS